MKSLTIIIPTHERHDYLRRSMAYFSEFDVSILYMDSSKYKFKGKVGSNIEYIHCPALQFSQKVRKALDYTKSELIAFCADDDFLLKESLQKGQKIMNENAQLGAVVGNFVGFTERFDGRFFELYPKRKLVPVKSGDAKFNVENYLSNYHQILWGLFRRDVIKIAYDIIEQSKFKNDNFIEMVIATVCSARGGICLIEDYWCAREVSQRDHWGKRHTPLYLIKDLNYSNIDVANFTKNLNTVIDHGLAELALSSYLNSQKSRYLLIFLRNLAPNFIKDIFRVFKRRAYINEKSLDRVYEALQK